MSSLSANTSSCGGDGSLLRFGVLWLAAGEDMSLGDGASTGWSLSMKEGISSSVGGADESEDKGEDEPLILCCCDVCCGSERGSYVKGRSIGQALGTSSVPSAIVVQHKQVAFA